MGFLKEFKEFAIKGNVIDLAVGVIIGAAFGTIVQSAVNDLIMPPISLLIGDKGFVNLYYPLGESVKKALEITPTLSLEEARKLGPVLAWGNFITQLLNFVILALIIFIMVKGVNSLKRGKNAPAAAPPSNEEVLLSEIRDLLKSGK